jgi:o-succinylbenzoate synthase
VKIARIRWSAYRVPFRAPYTTSQGSVRHREGLFLELTTGDGLVGLGEAAPVPELGVEGDALAQTFASVAGGLVGLDIDEITGLEPARACEDESEAALACALDTAVCDLSAQSQGVSLASFLRAGAARTVDVNALVTQPDLLVAAQAATNAREAGYRTIKLKVGMAAEMTEECARVAAVRKAIGPELKLRLDPNGAWTVAAALEALRAMAPLAIEYVEQPMAPGNLDAMRYLQEHVAVALAADEDVTDLEAARRIIQTGAARVLILKPQRLGGLRACLPIIDAARAAGLACVVTTSIEAGIGTAACLQLGAALPPGLPACGLATALLLESDLTSAPIPVVNGSMRLPDSPGLGVRLDAAALARYSDGWHEVT